MWIAPAVAVLCLLLVTVVCIVAVKMGYAPLKRGADDSRDHLAQPATTSNPVFDQNRYAQSLGHTNVDGVPGAAQDDMHLRDQLNQLYDGVGEDGRNDPHDAQPTQDDIHLRDQPSQPNQLYNDVEEDDRNDPHDAQSAPPVDASLKQHNLDTVYGGTGRVPAGNLQLTAGHVIYGDGGNEAIEAIEACDDSCTAPQKTSNAFGIEDYVPGDTLAAMNRQIANEAPDYAELEYERMINSVSQVPNGNYEKLAGCSAMYESTQHERVTGFAGTKSKAFTANPDAFGSGKRASVYLGFGGTQDADA